MCIIICGHSSCSCSCGSGGEVTECRGRAKWTPTIEWVVRERAWLTELSEPTIEWPKATPIIIIIIICSSSSSRSIKVSYSIIIIISTWVSEMIPE